MFNEQRNTIENSFSMVIITISQYVAIPCFLFIIISLKKGLKLRIWKRVATLKQIMRTIKYVMTSFVAL